MREKYYLFTLKKNTVEAVVHRKIRDQYYSRKILFHLALPTFVPGSGPGWGRSPGVTKSRLTPLSHGLTKPYLHPNKLLLLPRRCRCRGLSSAARGQGGRERVGTPILNFSHDDAYRAPCLLCRNRTRRRRPVPTQDAPCSLCRSDDRAALRAASTPVVTEDLQPSAPLYGH